MEVFTHIVVSCCVVAVSQKDFATRYQVVDTLYFSLAESVTTESAHFLKGICHQALVLGTHNNSFLVIVQSSIFEPVQGVFFIYKVFRYFL